jgi:hypothetical protein
MNESRMGLLLGALSLWLTAGGAAAGPIIELGDQSLGLPDVQMELTLPATATYTAPENGNIIVKATSFGAAYFVNRIFAVFGDSVTPLFANKSQLPADDQDVGVLDANALAPIDLGYFDAGAEIFLLMAAYSKEWGYMGPYFVPDAATANEGGMQRALVSAFGVDNLDRMVDIEDYPFSEQDLLGCTTDEPPEDPDFVPQNPLFSCDSVMSAIGEHGSENLQYGDVEFSLHFEPEPSNPQEPIGAPAPGALLLVVPGLIGLLMMRRRRIAASR